MTNKALSLEQPEYVTRCVNRWRSQPIDMIIIEYAGTGDPYFGGSAEDLPLGKNGDITDALSDENSDGRANDRCFVRSSRVNDRDRRVG